MLDKARMRENVRSQAGCTDCTMLHTEGGSGGAGRAGIRNTAAGRGLQGARMHALRAAAEQQATGAHRSGHDRGSMRAATWVRSVQQVQQKSPDEHFACHVLMFALESLFKLVAICKTFFRRVLCLRRPASARRTCGSCCCASTSTALPKARRPPARSPPKTLLLQRLRGPQAGAKTRPSLAKE